MAAIASRQEGSGPMVAGKDASMTWVLLERIPDLAQVLVCRPDGNRKAHLLPTSLE